MKLTDIHCGSTPGLASYGGPGCGVGGQVGAAGSRRSRAPDRPGRAAPRLGRRGVPVNAHAQGRYLDDPALRTLKADRAKLARLNAGRLLRL